MNDERAQRDGSTVDPAEVARFSRLAETWWSPRGSMRMLHAYNPIRLSFIKEQAAFQFGRDGNALDALQGLRVLDIGCGGGILSEPLARMGAKVVGADPSAENIAVAKLHAERSGLAIDYRAQPAEALADAGERFDIVLAMEVVEHVADMPLFVARCAEMVKPGGLMVAATINRTLKSFALAIVGAEYVMGWLPRGTHQWDKLVRPEELRDAFERAGLHVVDHTGIIYNPLTERWRRGSDDDVNYITAAAKGG